MENNDGASDKHGRKPLGRVEKVNGDGTVTISFNESNPLAMEIAIAGIIGGTAAANAVLKAAQEAGKN